MERIKGETNEEERCCSRGVLLLVMCHLQSSTKLVWLQAYRPGFITRRIQATSTSAQVRAAMPAQISFSHLKSCSGSESAARVSVLRSSKGILYNSLVWVDCFCSRKLFLEDMEQEHKHTP